MKRLRWIDDLFQGLSSNTHLSCQAWILEAPLVIDGIQQTLDLLGPTVINEETPLGFDQTFRRRRRDGIAKAKATKLATVNAEVGRIDAIIQIVSSENPNGPSVASRLVLSSKGTTGSESYLYFPKLGKKQDTPHNRPRLTHQRSWSAPQIGGSDSFSQVQFRIMGISDISSLRSCRTQAHQPSLSHTFLVNGKVTAHRPCILAV
jgi:hypothetical protein